MAINPRQAAAKKAVASNRTDAVARGKEVEKTVKGYIKNVTSAYKRWDDLKTAPAQNPEAGQFWGALLQNRTYDTKTGKQITGKTGPLKKMPKR